MNLEGVYRKVAIELYYNSLNLEPPLPWREGIEGRGKSGFPDENYIEINALKWLMLDGQNG